MTDTCDSELLSCLTVYTINSIHDDGAITINENPTSILKEGLKGTVFPYSNDKGSRYLVYFKPDELRMINDILEQISQNKKTREDEIIEETENKLRKVCNMCNKVMDFNEWTELKCNTCIFTSNNKEILDKALESKKNLLLKVGKDLGLSENKLNQIITNNGLDGSKSLDFIIGESKKSNNAQQNWGKVAKLNKQAQKLKLLSSEMKESKEKKRLIYQYKPCLTVKDIGKWHSGMCNDYEDHTQLLSKELVENLREHNLKLEQIEDQRLKNIKDVNERFEKCINTKNIDNWNSDKCYEYTKNQDVLTNELLQKLQDKNNALNKIEQDRLSKIEILKENYSKCFKHNNIANWDRDGCSDYTNHNSVLGEVMSDQLANYKGKLIELKRKNLLKIQLTTEKFTPCLNIQDLQSWVDSKENCDTYTQFEKSLDNDVYKNLNIHKQTLKTTYDKNKQELIELTEKFNSCLQTNNLDEWDSKQCDDYQQKSALLKTIGNKDETLDVKLYNKKIELIEIKQLADEEAKRLADEQIRLEKIERERLNKIKEMAKRYEKCLKSDYNSWNQNLVCTNFKKNEDLKKDDPTLYKQLINIETGLNEIEAERTSQIKQLMKKYEPCLITSNVKDWNSQKCERFSTEKLLKESMISSNLLTALKEHDDKLKLLHAKMLEEEEKLRIMQEALKKERDVNIKKCKKCLTYNEPDMEGYNKMCNQCIQYEKEGLKIGNKSESLLEHRNHITKLIIQKETADKLAREVESCQKAFNYNESNLTEFNQKFGNCLQLEQQGIDIKKNKPGALKNHQQYIRDIEQKRVKIEKEQAILLSEKRKKELDAAKLKSYNHFEANCKKYLDPTEKELESDWNNKCDLDGDWTKNLDKGKLQKLKKAKQLFETNRALFLKQTEYELKINAMLENIQSIINSDLLSKQKITNEADINKLNEIVLSLSALSKIEGVNITPNLIKTINNIMTKKGGGGDEGIIPVRNEFVDHINKFIKTNQVKLTKVSTFINHYNNKIIQCQNLSKFTPDDFLKLDELEKNYANCEDYEQFNANYKGKRQDLINSAKFNWGKLKGKQQPRDMTNLTSEQINIFDKYASAGIANDNQLAQSEALNKNEQCIQKYKNPSDDVILAGWDTTCDSGAGILKFLPEDKVPGLNELKALHSDMKKNKEREIKERTSAKNAAKHLAEKAKSETAFKLHQTEVNKCLDYDNLVKWEKNNCDDLQTVNQNKLKSAPSEEYNAKFIKNYKTFNTSLSNRLNELVKQTHDELNNQVNECMKTITPNEWEDSGCNKVSQKLKQLQSDVKNPKSKAKNYEKEINDASKLLVDKIANIHVEVKVAQTAYDSAVKLLSTCNKKLEKSSNLGKQCEGEQIMKEVGKYKVILGKTKTQKLMADILKMIDLQKKKQLVEEKTRAEAKEKARVEANEKARLLSEEKSRVEAEKQKLKTNVKKCLESTKSANFNKAESCGDLLISQKGLEYEKQLLDKLTSLQKAENDALIEKAKQEALRLKLIEEQRIFSEKAKKAQEEFLQSFGKCINNNLNNWNKDKCDNLLSKGNSQQNKELNQHIDNLRKKAQQTLEASKQIEKQITLCNNAINLEKWNISNCDSLSKQLNQYLKDIDTNGSNSDYMAYEDALINGTVNMKETKTKLAIEEEHKNNELRNKNNNKLTENIFNLINNKYSKCENEWNNNCDKYDWIKDENTLKKNNVPTVQISELKNKYELLKKYKTNNYIFKPCLTVKDLNTWAINECQAFHLNKNTVSKTLFDKLIKYENYLDNEDKTNGRKIVSNLLSKVTLNNCLQTQGGPNNINLWESSGCSKLRKDILEKCSIYGFDFTEVDELGKTMGLTNIAHNFLQEQWEKGTFDRIPEKGLYIVHALSMKEQNLKLLNEKFNSSVHKRLKPNCKPRHSSVRNIHECCSKKSLSRMGDNFECAGGSAKKSRKKSHKR